MIGFGMCYVWVGVCISSRVATCALCGASKRVSVVCVLHLRSVGCACKQGLRPVLCGVWCVVCGALELVVFVWTACQHCTPVRLPPFADFSSHVNLSLSLFLPPFPSLCPSSSLLTPCPPASLPSFSPFLLSLALAGCLALSCVDPGSLHHRRPRGHPPDRLAETQGGRECNVYWYSMIQYPYGNDD